MSRQSADHESRTALASTAGGLESVRTYQLLEALRSGDPATINPLLAFYPTESSLRRSSSAQQATEAAPDLLTSVSTPLHLAVRCAKYPTVQLVLRYAPFSVNAKDAKGQTPLHVAAELNRLDVISLFLNEPFVDDMIRDSAGKTCLDVAAGPDASRLISVSRSDYNEQYLQLLSNYVESPVPDGPNASISRISPTSASATSTNSRAIPTESTSSVPSTTAANPSPLAASTLSPYLPQIQVSAASGHVSNVAAEKLYHFLVRPRSSCIHFGAMDPSGTTILHEAARRKDLGIIKLVLSRGGDVFARDKKGKTSLDVAKDDRIKQVLQDAASKEGRALRAAANPGTAHAVPLGQPPSHRGYLSKWTNMARGYRSRWFVLENGMLSYYRSQEEEGKATRGSISMTVAKVQPPGQDKLKFEVTNKLEKSFPSFWLKGAHPVEVQRWVEVLRQNIEYARDQAAMTRTSSNVSYAPSISSTYNGGARRSSVQLGANDAPRDTSPGESLRDHEGSIGGDDDTFNGDDDEAVPRAEDFGLLATSTKTQLELSLQLVDSLSVSIPDRLVASASSGPDSRPASVMSATSSRQGEVKEALKGSLTSLGSMLDEYIDVVAQRERYFQRKYEREIEAKRLWEENMKEVAAQHALVEEELKKVGRDSVRRKRALQEVRANLSSPTMTPHMSGTIVEGGDQQLAEDGALALPPSIMDAVAADVPVSPVSLTASTHPRLSFLSTESQPNTRALNPAPTNRRNRSSTLNPAELEQIVDSALVGEGDDDSESEDEEFFEAIEAGSLSISPLDSPAIMTPIAEKYMGEMDLTPYEGYRNLRSKLPIDNDNRPPVSLWAILKGSIGKDLSKISFPVFFNEPTSMLQRMSEDLEFSECCTSLPVSLIDLSEIRSIDFHILVSSFAAVDFAAADPDPTKRLAYVAAYAMSNYSSTIGRIAKPFNPMLGETFEYVDIKKRYRYISEQVLHHPPVSACIAQAPTWEYFGEVDAKSRFTGKAFEITPTGVAHVNLRIPKAWGTPDCPPVPHLDGLVTEHYSWKKVTTCVSNFFFGSPLIDHYGDMIVTNHRTGDTCTLTFKPRGWRGSGACEIKGKVVDSKGVPCWDIAGRWNDQLVARRVGEGHGDLAPDATLPTTRSGEIAPEYIRLWKNSVKPPGMPFNLTPFAITLNDDNPELRKWLPPTDCRLRPDQHAFESGEFERANDLKSALEDHQRATRKKRDAHELPAHRARWFTKKRDPDTDQEFWEPAKTEEGTLEYWEERKRVGLAKIKEGKQVAWKGVDPIFADF